MRRFLPVNYVEFEWTTTDVDQDVRIPLDSATNPTLFVEWGDGTSNLMTNADVASQTHIYATAGVYWSRVYGAIASFRFNNTTAAIASRLTRVRGLFTNLNPVNSFRQATGLVAIESKIGNTRGKTSFASHARACSSLVSLDLSYMDFSSVINCFGICSGDTNLQEVLVGDAFNNTPCTNFNNAFVNCALNQSSVDAILISINNANTSNGTLTISGGTNAPASNVGQLAANALQSRGWVVALNYLPSVMIVEMGQSNMEGRFGADPLHTSVTGTAFYWNGSSPIHLLNTRGGATGGSHATYFANRLLSLTGQRPILLEVAAGGAGLGADSGSSGTNHWGASGNRRTDTQAQIAACIAGVSSITAPTAGLWCQGERDAQQIDTEPSYTRAAVKIAMQSVIDWWQGQYPGVPFLISQLGRPSSADTAGYQDVREIQSEIVSENVGVYMAFTGAVGFPAAGKMGDELHYNALGLQDMGEAFADTLATVLG